MDIKKILGDAYKEGMTFEEIEAALKDVEIPKGDEASDVEKLKTALSKSNSEAAEYKRQLRAKMTEDEQKEAERATKEAERDALLASLQKDKAISENKAQFLALGYESALAEETAEAMADGDMAKVFKNQKKHLEAVEKKVRAEALKDTPKPTPDGDSKIMTLDKLRKMSPTERLEFSTNHPEDYKTLYGGNE